MEIGERWAYRARGIDPVVEVEVLRQGTQKPARVLVRFTDDAFEGREEWVPPARLKVPWTDAPAYEARLQRWEAVDTHPGLRSSPEEYAIDEVFEHLIDDSLATPGYRPGVTAIENVSGLAAFLRIDESELRAEPESFEEDGSLIVPWATTERIVRRACELYPEAVLREVDKDEAKAAEEAMHGRSYARSRGNEPWYVAAERVAEWDATEPYGRPMRDLLREWCGVAAVERQDEIKALRSEVERLDRLVSGAIGTLRAHGLHAQADTLQREFGVPLPEARRSR